MKLFNSLQRMNNLTMAVQNKHVMSIAVNASKIKSMLQIFEYSVYFMLRCGINNCLFPTSLEINLTKHLPLCVPSKNDLKLKATHYRRNVFPTLGLV